MRWIAVRLAILQILLFQAPVVLASVPVLPDLLTLHERALEHDASLQAARRQRDAGREAHPQGRAGLLPSLEVSAERARERRWSDQADLTGDTQRQRRDSNQTLYQVSLSQPVVRFDRWYAYREGQVTASLADLEFIETLQVFHRELITTYVETLRAKLALDTVMARQDAVEAQLRQAESRQQAGLTSRLDVQDARAEQGRTRVELVRAQARVEERFRELESLTGLTLLRLAPLRAGFDPREHEPAPLEIFLESAVARNARIQRLESAERQADFRVKGARARYMPNVDLNISASRDNTRFDDNGSPFGLEDTESDSVRVGLQLSMPLFSGGRNASAHREARYQREQAGEELRAMVTETRRNVEISHRNLNSLRDAFAAAAASVAAQEETLAATERSYQAGLRDTVDVVRAQRAVFDAREDYEATRLDYLLELVALHQHAGLLDTDFLATINHWLEARQ